MRWPARSFRWEGFASLNDLRNQLVGAVLMGFGGVTAMGCTVGQGLSGLSTLALGSFIAVAGIVAGAVATLKYMLWRAEREHEDVLLVAHWRRALLAAARPHSGAGRRQSWVAEARTVATLDAAQAAGGAAGGDRRSGPEGAIAICRDKAPALARAASEQSGWTVRRVSLRNRNPKAVPDAWEHAALQDFDRRAAAGSRRRRWSGPRWCTKNGHAVQRYMRALPTQPSCARSCHGTADKLSPAVTAKLKALYPDDRAMGYGVGEIRGAMTLRQARPEQLQTAALRPQGSTAAPLGRLSSRSMAARPLAAARVAAPAPAAPARAKCSPPRRMAACSARPPSPARQAHRRRSATGTAARARRRSWRTRSGSTPRRRAPAASAA